MTSADSLLTPAAAGPDGFEQLRAAIAACIGIAHHVPGRIRLKLNSRPEGLAMPSGSSLRRFQELLGRVDGVRSLRVNVLALSCTVEYDPGKLPFEAWPDFLAGTRTRAADVLEARLRHKYEEAVAALDCPT